MGRMPKLGKVICIALFFGLLWLPVLQMALRFYPEFEEAEKRELAKPPQLSLEALSRLPREFNGYAADNFGFRPDLIRWNSILKTRLLGISPIPSVIVGKDAWLFYCSEALADGNTINDYRGTIPLPDSELVKLQQRLEENRREFSKRNILYVVVIVPNKNTVYGEYLPDGIVKHRPTTRLDQLMSHLEKHSTMRVIDLRETFHRARVEHPLYWKTDSHWNSYGAYVAYAEIMKHISMKIPAVRSISVSPESVRVETSPAGGDLAQMLFMQDLLPEENETRFSARPAREGRLLGTLLFRHDSFGDGLYPFLRMHFKSIVNIAPFAPYPLEDIERRKPEVLLHVFAERYITQALHDDFYYREVTPGSLHGVGEAAAAGNR
jgi:alginate O-acetyltransferase complex protein AlgJ